ncbi:MAG: phosphatase PAP2 family protein [Thermoleophilia bacterium]
MRGSLSTAHHATGHPRAAAVASAVRRTHSLPAEIAVILVTMLAWQVLRLPFEVSAERAVAATRALVDLERHLGAYREPGIVTFVQSHHDLARVVRWWYGHMDEGPVLGILVAMWFIDPARYPVVRTAFVLAHLPALALLALYPSAPPRWLAGYPYGAGPPPGWEGGLRNSTAAVVSLHVGIPLLLAVAAVWMRPRAPLAWALWAFPAVVLFVITGTGNHLFADAVLGAACAMAGWWAALRLHGPVPRGAPRAGPGPTGLAAAGSAGAVMAVAALMFGGLA